MVAHAYYLMHTSGGSDFEYIEDNQDNDEENNGETELSSINENN
jgi:hypothetical protein